MAATKYLQFFLYISHRYIYTFESARRSWNMLSSGSSATRFLSLAFNRRFTYIWEKKKSFSLEFHLKIIFFVRLPLREYRIIINLIFQFYVNMRLEHKARRAWMTSWKRINSYPTHNLPLSNIPIKFTSYLSLSWVYFFCQRRRRSILVSICSYFTIECCDVHGIIGRWLYNFILIMREREVKRKNEC